MWFRRCESHLASHSSKTDDDRRHLQEARVICCRPMAAVWARAHACKSTKCTVPRQACSLAVVGVEDRRSAFSSNVYLATFLIDRINTLFVKDAKQVMYL